MQMFLISYRAEEHFLFAHEETAFPRITPPTLLREKSSGRLPLLPPPHTHASRHNRKSNHDEIRRKRKAAAAARRSRRRRKISQKRPEARKAQRVLCALRCTTTMHGRATFILLPLSPSSHTHTRPTERERKKRGGPSAHI